MNFELDDDQYALRDAVRRYLSDNAGAPLLRKHWDQGSNEVLLWPGLTDLGVLSLTVPEEQGGQGMAMTDIVLLVEELGRHAVPYPVAETIAVAAPILALHKDEAQRKQWLSDIAAGRLIASVQDGWDGQAAWARESHLVLVPTDDGVAVCKPSVDTRVFQDATDPSRRPGRVAQKEEIANIKGARAAELLRDYSRLSIALQFLGLTASCIERSVEYAKIREQFGRVIGSFQAIKHMLANAHLASETARRPCWKAAWCLDNNDAAGAAEAVAVAKGSACEAAVEASVAALQVHGAIGYTWECDLHLWMKRIHVLEGQFGGAKAQWRRLATMSLTKQSA